MGVLKLGLAALVGGSTAAAIARNRMFSASASAPTSLHDFTVRGIGGEAVDLSTYRGRVCVVVNVASK